MKVPTHNRPQNVTEAEADRIGHELLARIKTEAEAINFGGMVEIDQALASWAPDGESLNLNASITLYDETGSIQCLVAQGNAGVPTKEDGKWFLTWTLSKRNACLA